MVPAGFVGPSIYRLGPHVSSGSKFRQTTGDTREDHLDLRRSAERLGRPGAPTRYCRGSPRCGAACTAEGAAVTVLTVVVMVLVGFVLVVAALVMIFRLRQRRIASR